MKRKRRILLIFGITILIVVFVSILLLNLLNKERIPWGARIADLSLSRKTSQEAKTILENKTNDYLNQEIVLNVILPSNLSGTTISSLIQEEKEYSFSVRLADLGIEIDCPRTISQVCQIGNQTNLLSKNKDQLLSLFGFYNLPLIFNINREIFDNKTEQLFKEIEQPLQNTSFVFDKEIDDFVLLPAKEGTVINRDDLLIELTERAKKMSTEAIDLKYINLFPEVENNEVDQALEKARQIVNTLPFYLSSEDDYWTIYKSRLIDWIKFEPIQEKDSDNLILGLVLDEEKIKEYLDWIASNIDHPAINAQLEIENNKAAVFIPEKEGIELQIEETADNFIENILAEPPVKTTSLIIDKKAKPKISLSQTNSLGINQLIGQGTSNFSGSPKNRINNIKTGVNIINGAIIAPGQEFSFNNVIGKTGPEQGFLEELVIKEDEIIPEYGGGVCQISTTVFRAAVNTGLKVIERSPHTIPITYYNPAGFDATVYDPKPDLRFINNTPNYILLEGIVKNYNLTFNIYGTDDNREVKISGPTVLEKKEDGSMKTVLNQKVSINGEIVEEKAFYSNYRSPDEYKKEEEE